MKYSFLNGTFNEYLTISLSWADTLIISIIIIYTIKAIYKQVSHAFVKDNLLNNNISSLSTYPRFPISRETMLFALLLLWIGFSILWSPYKPIAIYRFLSFLELFLFSLIALRLLNDNKLLNISFVLLVINGLFQSLLGIAQFIHNGSLGFRLFGESIIGPNIDGVAKILINGEKYVRSYGTLPHPNILAGFLIIPIFILISKIITKARIKLEPNSNVPRETIFKNASLKWLIVFLLLILIGFFLTFSRSAFLGLIIGLIIFLFFNKNIFSQFRMGKKLKVISSLVFISIVIFLFCLIFRTSIFSMQSFEERTLYNNVSHETISNNPIAGIGIGQFVLSEYSQKPNLPGWQYQPVHNVILLIFSELGVIGLALFLFIMIRILITIKFQKAMHKKIELTYISFYCIIIFYTIIAFFDHYLWDIKSGMVTLVLSITFFMLLREKSSIQNLIITE